MGVTVKPTEYISWVPLGKISVRFAEAYISWLPMGTISLRPQIAASIVPPAETQVTVTVDAKRLKVAAMPDIMQNFHDHGIRSFSTTLGELTLSDTFTLETVQPMEIDDAVQGQILDYSFRFLVEETSQRDLVQTVKGMYSKDALLYTAIHISVEEANVSYYVQEISCALGLEADMACDDFIPSQDYQDSGMTYQDFISSLFGWTSKLPQRQINVFIRGDTLHVIQRGLEKSVVDITDWPHSRPTIDKKLVRSIWHSSNNENGDNHAHNEEDDEPVPFSGTISLGEISRTYQNGFLVRETNEEGYTEYLSSKRTHNKDGSTSQTRYLYAETDRDVYLFKEQERSTDPINDGRTHNEYDWTDWNNENGTERITYHAPLGYGWYATTVYVDGALEGSSLSQGKPGGKASRFTIDQSNLSLGAHYSSYYDEDGTAMVLAIGAPARSIHGSPLTGNRKRTGLWATPHPGIPTATLLGLTAARTAGNPRISAMLRREVSGWLSMTDSMPPWRAWRTSSRNGHSRTTASCTSITPVMSISFPSRAIPAGTCRYAPWGRGNISTAIRGGCICGTTERFPRSSATTAITASAGCQISGSGKEQREGLDDG